ncbi:DUF2075 domain-containing protein [Spiribacter sp. C176]|uniref:DUF2075 domain-containing protein n=1 Tax=Spiribacter salilacus TaxID=2664894 RepID=A0A6N7QY45_9GAMM|nr:DNA/RNA helicase domain-containing protein [Spiribacter salilacus]MRH77604.1 DUF2075 domain-containing protein [Spiribacter salilacus]
MSQSQTPQVTVQQYTFGKQVLVEIDAHPHASNNWPVVYILSDKKTKSAYVGETTNAKSRLSTHLKDKKKQKLTTAALVSSTKFNKSAALDIEASLIRYLAGDGNLKPINSNLGGAIDHNYYQKNELYREIFQETWDNLRRIGLVQRSLESIDNSDVFKYSPYKTLSADQRESLIGILTALLDDRVKTLLVEGGAGTGKSVLAIFLFKLLHSDLDDIQLREFSDDGVKLRELVTRFKERFPEPRMALVVPMSSFRSTLKRAFSQIAGLSAKMVIGPAELARQHYDVVLVDEAHRLRQRKNLGSYFGRFDAVCKELGMDAGTASEVDWVLAQSTKSVFFYDENQSIKPSDADSGVFKQLKKQPTTQQQMLLSQFRVNAGNSYSQFISDLLRVALGETEVFRSKQYELKVFDRIDDLIATIEDRNEKQGLSRLVAGFSWPWVSKNNPQLFDIQIENTALQWNRTNNDWINSDNAVKEVGCIHTTQGYDLNYAGVIFGHEIKFDPDRQEIIIDVDRYFDKNGKTAIDDPAQLKQYILNIYQTILMRGIRGTFIYACDPALRAYLKQHIPTHQQVQPPAADNVVELKPFVNAVPLYNLDVAAGAFSDLQMAEVADWVAVPPTQPIDETYFACRVIGESMNRIIPNGATCLFRKDPGGSRNGKIVLVELTNLRDQESGYGYTIKEYQSIKTEDDDGFHHQIIRLKPRSSDPSIAAIELTAQDDAEFHVVGVFEGVLDDG